MNLFTNEKKRHILFKKLLFSHHKKQQFIPSMTVYKFRISFEDHEEVTRDIEILPTQTFEEMHIAIQAAIGFDNSKGASFYMSNDHWIKGEEITLNNRNNKTGKTIAIMASSRLCDYISDPHQKIYYISDFAANWSFYVELIKITKHEESVSYPRCVRKTGEAPKQYGASILGKANTDFDFLDQSMLDAGSEEGDGDDMAEFEEEPAMSDDGNDSPEAEDDQQEQEEI